MADTFDVLIIGGGPGGYVAAIRGAQLGLNVACADPRETLGGTCLNVGCIPSKALLQSSHLYHQTLHDLDAHGIQVGKPKLDLAAMLARKDKVVDDLTKGIDFLFKKNKVTRLVGAAKIIGPGQAEVAGKAYQAKHIVIATGSVPASVPGVKTDGKNIVTSTEALAFDQVPKHLAVIGAGVIGLELGSVWSRLGADVTVIEYADTILAGQDDDIVKQAGRTFKKQGLTLKTGTKVAAAKSTKTGVTLSLETLKTGKSEEIKADKVLVATGRKPFTEGLGLDAVGIETDERGFIPVDAHYQTSQPGIYAIGDVIGGAMLAHKAEEEGVACMECIAGQAGHVNYGAIPAVVYTHPEIASLGQTEHALKDAGVGVKTGKFPFSANSRAKATGDTEGFVKIIADAKTDKILGCHIIGPGAGELIQELALAMEFGGASEDVARTSHAHPGTAEAVKEAAMAVLGRALHM